MMPLSAAEQGHECIRGSATTPIAAGNKLLLVLIDEKFGMTCKPDPVEA